MATVTDYASTDQIAWCPGCGNFGILASLKRALSELNLLPEQVTMVSGIGQSSKLPHYLKANMFNGLHGRGLPAAAGIRIANTAQTVIAVGGDGDGYAEGGNHFIHAMRRNVTMAYFVHNNQIYGLTKGQASPTTDERMVTGTTPEGSYLKPENPLLLAIASDCSFVARGFSGDGEQLVSLMKQAIIAEGFSFIDILQPCISFNRINTYAWYKERVRKIDETAYDPFDRIEAFRKASEWGGTIPTGVLYRNKRKSYESIKGLAGSLPLLQRPHEFAKIAELLDGFR